MSANRDDCRRLVRRVSQRDRTQVVALIVCPVAHPNEQCIVARRVRVIAKPTVVAIGAECTARIRRAGATVVARAVVRIGAALIGAEPINDARVALDPPNCGTERDGSHCAVAEAGLAEIAPHRAVAIVVAAPDDASCDAAAHAVLRTPARPTDWDPRR